MEPDQLAELYEAHHAEGDKYGFLYAGPGRGALLASWIGQGRDVLDVGCRDGTLTRCFAKGNKVTGLDIDRRALEICRQTLGITTHWCDASKGLPVADAAFDAACAAEILEHIPYPNRLVADVARVLRPGGVFVGSVPNAFRLKNRIRFLFGREFETDPTHLHWYSPEALRRLLSAHFEAIELRYLASRWLWASPRLMANDICFRAVKQRTPA